MDNLDAVAICLANRTYLHRLFHVIFGAVPSQEEYEALTCEQTQQAFGRLLGGGLGSVDCVQGDAVALGNDVVGAIECLAALAQRDADDWVDEMKSIYNRVFLVPGASYVHPWESPYIGKETMLFQESTLDVRACYRRYGYAAVEYKHFPEDHVSMMMDFLSRLSERAYAAFGDGDDAQLKELLAFQKDFTERHLLNWIDLFCDKLSEREGGFYCCFARAMAAFLRADCAFAEEMAKAMP